MTTKVEKHILTLEEVEGYGLPEEVITDLKFGTTQRVLADAMEKQAEAMKGQANEILEAALCLLGVFAASWDTSDLGDVGEVKSIMVNGRAFTRVVSEGRASLDKDKMKQYLVGHGVSVDVVAAAIQAGTTVGKGSVLVRVSPPKGERV